MTIPLWVLLGFAVWTLLLLVATIGVYRWSRLLTGRASFGDYGHVAAEGADWYKRALRAHANCVENLPVYGALVLVITAAHLESQALDILALVFLGARIGHSSVHVALVQSSRVVFARSMLFNTQWLCMMAMAVIIAVSSL